MLLLKMGTRRSLASRLALLALLATFCGVIGTPRQARSAVYGPKNYFVTGSFSFDVINPNDLNNLTGGTAPLPGLIGGRFQIERGLFGPSWSHWVEFDYFTGSASASGDAGNFNQSLTYMSIVPLGVTYWFARTAFIDFGVSAGIGLGPAPSYTFTSTTNAGVSTTTNYTGKLGPVYAARLEARFWLSRYLAATVATGLHVFSSSLTASGAPTLNAALTGFSMIGGVTLAFGGVQGTGRSYVEVIHDKPDTKKQTAGPAPAPKNPKSRGKTPVTGQPQTAAPTESPH